MDNLPEFALSIRQPWAWAIIHAGKDVENRSWRTDFRGPVCIHAAKGIGSRHDYFGARNFITDEIRAKSPPDPDQIDRGGIIGVAEIVDCVETSESPWFVGRYGFVLRNARPVPFISVRGLLGFFRWQDQMPEPHNG